MARTQAEIDAAQQSRVQPTAGSNENLLLPELRLPPLPERLRVIDPRGCDQWARDVAGSIRQWTKDALFNLRGR